MDVRSGSHGRVTGRTGGPVVALAHGRGCDQDMWRPVAREPYVSLDGKAGGVRELGLGRTDPDVARAFPRVTFLSDDRADLPHVRVPALVSRCSSDAVARPEAGACGHVKTAPERTAAVVAAFAGATW
ncbi:hypothetical protein [Streptomyces sp. ALB3]|uniref:hypothetical protein n=1 Tax=Streptomyces sp. ALB3 TaxID=3374278 RepID=UPI003791B104